jgi:SAM-dependent methyltransferase
VIPEGDLPGKPFFEDVYKGRAPWDIQAPQPDLVRMIDEVPPRGRILDAGCGTGDLAIALARMGHAVLGVDFVAAAIDVARARAAALPPDQRELVDFTVGDAVRLSEFKGRIDSVVDSGFLHLFNASTRRTIADELASVLPAGGLYYMLGFAVTFPVPSSPRAVTAEEMEALFSTERGWVVRVSRAARFRTFGFDDVPALAFCAERTAG